MATSLPIRPILVALLSILFAYSYAPSLSRTATVLGVFRQPTSTLVASSADFVVVDGTTHCEDLHYHEPSRRLYTACQESNTTRFYWFPPLATFKDVTAVTKGRGGLYVIDPEAQKAQKLELENFDIPFMNHGIDVISDPARPEGEAVYIFGVNHLPNPDYHGPYPYSSAQPPVDFKNPKLKARSQIELFHHVVGSASARHVRSVRHPLIRTPNDVLALGPAEFLVTNDHLYAEGFLRTVEDVYSGAAWSSTIHAKFFPSLEPSGSAADGVNATVVLDKIHNNNGLGRGRTKDEVLVNQCTSGILRIGEISVASTGSSRMAPEIRLHDSIQFESNVDNPSYFSDPYANSSYDASGFVQAGVDRPIDIPKLGAGSVDSIGVMVFYAKPSPREGGWETRLVFQDDGSRISSASSAVFVVIDPSREEDGRRRAWLYVTGFMSENVVAVKIYL